jgi:hypothetical protein
MRLIKIENTIFDCHEIVKVKWEDATTEPRAAVTLKDGVTLEFLGKRGAAFWKFICAQAEALTLEPSK